MERAVLEHAPELELPTQGQQRKSSVPPPGPGPRQATAPDRPEVPGRRQGAQRPSQPMARRWALVGVVVVALAAAAISQLVDHGDNRPAASGSQHHVTATGMLAQSLSLPSEPGSAASGDGSLWVTSPVSGILYRVDPSTGAVQATIGVGTGAGALASSGADVWVANTVTGTLAEVSVATDQVVQTFAVGSEPTGVAVGNGSVWVADATSSALVSLDINTGRVTTYPLSSAPFGIAFGAGSLWLSSPGTDSVTRWSTQGGPAVQVPVGGGPTAVAFALGSLWVTNGLDNTVSRLSPVTDSVVATVPVGDAPDAMAVAGGSVWVANRLSSTLTRIDGGDGAVLGSVAVAGSPLALAAYGRRVWAAAGGAVGRQSGGTLHVVSSVPTPSIDPALALPQQPFEFFEGTYDTLVTYQRVGGNGGLELVPDLALTMPTVTDGGTTYSFVLRAGLRYSDGQPVRPEDFRRALQRVLDLSGNFAPQLDEISGAASCETGRPCNLSRGITVSDRADAITFHLTAPDPAFLYQLAFQYNAPVPAGVPDRDVGTRPVPSTGPYMISRYIPGHQVIFVRNPYFREWSAAAEPAGSPDRIVWTFGQSIPQEMSEIEAGAADWSNDFIPDVGALAAKYPSQVHANPALSIDYVAFNTRVAPFNNPKVRQAFSLAADRAQLVAMLGGPDAASPTCQFIPPGVPGFRQYCPYTVDPTSGGDWVGPDLAVARNLVAQSGTEGMKVVFWSPPGAGPTSSFAVSVLRQLGYRTSMVSPSFQTFFENVNDSRRNVQVVDGSWYLSYPSPSFIFDQFFRCSDWKLADPGAVRNGSFFCNHALDREMDEADAEESTDPAQAAVTWAGVDRALTDAAPWVPLVNLTAVDFLSSRVTNYEYNPALPGVLLDQLEVSSG